MTAPFVTTLRARPGTVTVGSPGDSALTIRVQLLEAWDAVRVVADPGETVATVKAAALGALDASPEPLQLYYVSLRGAEILDESQSLAAAGVINGSTLLLSHKHRRAVR
jgi:hypothetical protein